MKPLLPDRQRLTIFLRAAVSLAILAYLAQRLDWVALSAALWQAEPLRVAGAFVVFGLAFVAAAVRWYCLLQVQGLALPWKGVCQLVLVGAFFNTFLLGSTGGDMVRLAYVFRRYPDSKARASMSVIMDRLLGLVVLLLLAAVFMSWQYQAFLSGSQTRSIALGIVAILVVLLAAAGLALTLPLERLPGWLNRLWKKVPLRALWASLLQGFRQHRQQRRWLGYAVLASLMVQLLVFLSAFLLASATGLQVGFATLAVIMTIVTCIISLPISIGGHGVREGAFLLMFAALGSAGIGAVAYSQEAVVVFSVLYFLLGLGWSLLGGIVYLLFDPARAIGYIEKSQ